MKCFNYIVYIALLLRLNSLAQAEDTIRYKGVKTCTEKYYRLINGKLEGDTNKTVSYFNLRGFKDSTLIYDTTGVKYKMKFMYYPNGNIMMTCSHNILTKTRDTTFYNRGYPDLKYDKKGNLTEAIYYMYLQPGELHAIPGIQARTVYTYDSLNRITESSMHNIKGKMIFTIGYRYSVGNTLSEMIWKDSTGRTVETGYSKTGKETDVIETDKNGKVQYHKKLRYNTFDKLVLEKDSGEIYNKKDVKRYTYLKFRGAMWPKKKYERSDKFITKSVYKYVLQQDSSYKETGKTKETGPHKHFFNKTVSETVIYFNPDNSSYKEITRNKKIGSDKRFHKKTSLVTITYFNKDSSTIYETYTDNKLSERKTYFQPSMYLPVITLKEEHFYKKAGNLYEIIERDRKDNMLYDLQLTETGDTAHLEQHYYTKQNLPAREKYFECDYKYVYNIYDSDEGITGKRTDEIFVEYVYEFY